MNKFRRRALTAMPLAHLALAGLLAGCSGREINGLEEVATARVEPLVFAEGFEALNRAGHSVWSDDTRYASFTNLAPDSAAMNSVDKQYLIGGNANILYTTLNFVGIDFRTQPVDATAMMHLHLDVQAPIGSVFKVKPVNFGGNNGSMNGQAELTFDATTTPVFPSGGWSALEIPLDAFPFPPTVVKSRLGQLVLGTPADPATATPLVLVDNIYGHR